MDYILKLSDSLELYLLNDEFNINRAAGAVNGTSAEPTGGTRTVVDTNGKLSITGGQLSILSNNSAWGPIIYYPQVTRTAGKILVDQFTVSSAAEGYPLGWRTSTGGQGQAGAFAYYIGSLYFEDSGVFGNENTKVAESLGTGTTYQLASVLRGTGAYGFIKGGVYTNWTLLYSHNSNSTATLYPAISNYSAVFTSDNIRIPTATWLPTPLAYDTFTRADGAIGSSETTGPDSQTTPSLAWTGGAISSNKNVITPTLGGELWDADASVFTSGTYAWVAQSTNTLANVSNSLEVTYVDNSYGVTEYLRDASDLSSNLTIGQWYGLQFDAKVNAGSSVEFKLYDTVNILGPTITNTDFQTQHIAFRGLSTTGSYLYHRLMGTGEKTYWDNLSLKPLTLSSLFSSVSTSDADVIADANVTMTAGTQAGLVLNLDSTSSPANFLIAYHDGTNVYLDKNVGGTYTNLISATTTYSAGATLRVITYHSDASTLKVRVYYNNAMVGTEQTVTDAGIRENTLHGLFSTYSGNTFDNFTLWARGTGGEYNGLDDTRGISEVTMVEIRKFLSDGINFSDSLIKRVVTPKLENLILLETPIKVLNIAKIESQSFSEKVANNETISFSENLSIIESIKLGQDRKLSVNDSLTISESLARTGDTLRLVFVENVNLSVLIDSAYFIRRAGDTAFMRTNYP